METAEARPSANASAAIAFTLSTDLPAGSLPGTSSKVIMKRFGSRMSFWNTRSINSHALFLTLSSEFGEWYYF
jgi:hypothetical protein